MKLLVDFCLFNNNKLLPIIIICRKGIVDDNMKYLKRLVFVSCFILLFSLCSNSVQAAENTADDYYGTICGYGYSETYEALNVLSEAHKSYPMDERFIQGLNDKAQIILSWSKGSQLNGAYDGAICGYNTIIRTEGISQNIKDEANVCLTLAKRREQGIAGRVELQKDYSLIENYKKEYEGNYEYQTINSYSTFGNYLFIENMSSYTNSDEIRFDINGIPMVSYSGDFHYNPVTIGQYALTLYDRYLSAQAGKNQDLKKQFLNVANSLLYSVDNTGALRYEFKYKHYLDDNEFEPGWVSAMSQGEALSVFARAYHLTGDRKYIEAGNAVFKFLITRTSEGGAMDDLGGLNESLAGHIFFQLYVTNPPSYTLNGHMYTLIGLYDWSNVSSDKKIGDQAKYYFNQGLETLRYILPYYDIGGFVTYDLGYLTKPGIKPTVNLNYYGTHITLLDALYRITGDKTFEDYSNLWISYVKKY
jgi:heparosan-N-sulfate-glucuronate 5-epimerase